VSQSGGHVFSGPRRKLFLMEEVSDPAVIVSALCSGVTAGGVSVDIELALEVGAPQIVGT